MASVARTATFHAALVHTVAHGAYRWAKNVTAAEATTNPRFDMAIIPAVVFRLAAKRAASTLAGV